MSFVYAPNSELRAVAQALVDRKTADNPFFKRFPITETPYSLVQWERMDSTFGLMQGRGYNNPAPAVKGLGSTRVTKTPGVYGDSFPIDELELTTRSQFATYGIPISIDDLILQRTRQGRTRLYNRMILHVVTLLTTGRYKVTDPKGAVIEEDAFSPQVFTPAVLWSTVATATPWADFQSMALLDIGLSVAFNQNAVAIMNQKTFNYYRQNQNANDIFGRKTKFGATYNGLAEINALHQEDGLPQIVIFNESYKDDTNTSQRFMPDGYVVVLGMRTDDDPIGAFLLTKNMNNKDGGSQLYYEVIDKQHGQPREIKVELGYNGGLGIFQPESIIVAKVA